MRRPSVPPRCAPARWRGGLVGPGPGGDPRAGLAAGPAALAGAPDGPGGAGAAAVGQAGIPAAEPTAGGAAGARRAPRHGRLHTAGPRGPEMAACLDRWPAAGERADLGDA